MKTLKDILEYRKIKISDFAKDISATSQQICNWFSRGNIPKKFVIPISKTLNIPLENVVQLKASNKNIQKPKQKEKV
ncbi:helix-turn-helix domain-containing protein [Aliarcobacter lanthieri]|uniref:helix-turn-helix domain-containing protein n=1 Tax=Aliarcobacter lanthieri TaxID=1355374 RepID=UPI003AAEA302